MRRIYAAALVAGISLTLFACTSDADGGGTSPATTPPVNPVELLKKSLSAIATTPAHQVTTVDTSVGSTITEADVDVPNKTISVTLTVAKQVIDIRLINQDLYVRRGSPRWKHFDMNKIPADNDIRSSLEVEKNLSILPGIVAATEVSPGKFEGRADLRKAADAAGTKAAKDELETEVALLGDTAKALPFTASVDGQGRLLSLSWTIDSSTTKSTTTLAFSDWGKPVNAPKPAADLTDEATAADYERF